MVSYCFLVLGGQDCIMKSAMSAGSWKRAKEFRRQDTPEDEASGEEDVHLA